MPDHSFKYYFRIATGSEPYDYQRSLACGCHGEWGIPCGSQMIDIPTGLGKTAAATLAWTWNRLGHPDPHHRASWPRRLVYCLPMRTLVEQTRDEIRGWLANLAASGLLPVPAPQVIVLMGGEEIDASAKDWDVHPDADAIIIGTQDMLLSRALNRGYGMARSRWPMHFALLNNDCLWVMDEVQLMGPGLAATTQLEGFRKDPALGSHNCHSWWMSATIRADWLRTVDLPASLLASEPIRLSKNEKESPPVRALHTAPKKLIFSNHKSGKDGIKEVAKYIASHRNSDGSNLVVVNTVKRAQSLHQEITRLLRKDAVPAILLHSRFRPQDRLKVLDAVRKAPPGAIIVSTQVIEAGVNLSCHSLFTELAPWSSMVQRFGRCNRWLRPDGSPHFSDAAIHWFDLDSDKESAPYSDEQLDAARAILNRLTSASIADLENIRSPETDRPEFRHVLRRKDLLELFDTTPDLAGADLDIDRFIRDADNSQVQVFWRDWEGNSPNGQDPTTEPQGPPSRDELCTTGIGDLADFIKKASAWRWNPLENKWSRSNARELIPGQIYLLHTSQGGYQGGENQPHPLGWTGDPKSKVQPVDAARKTPERYDGDPDSEFESAWESIAEHSTKVCKALTDLLLQSQPIVAALARQITNPTATLEAAARWHDWGKAHAAFQAKLDPSMPPPDGLCGFVAKAPRQAWSQARLPFRPAPDDLRRRHFRHELASAIGVLDPVSDFPIQEAIARNLAAYLIASHHGKVRLSIRSLPDEWIPPRHPAYPDGRRFARGVWEGDAMPTTDLGGGTTVSETTLSLELMELGLCECPPFEGQPSWTERALNLRDTFGPFLLAYLETLLRAADAQASSTNRPA
jgi:CRISPR-associated endonuclease/helicase Cas3